MQGYFSLEVFLLLIEDIEFELESVDHPINFLLPQFHIFKLELLTNLSFLSLRSILTLSERLEVLMSLVALFWRLIHLLSRARQREGLIVV